MEITERSLWAAVAEAVPGNHVGDIGAAVVRTVEGTRYGIVRDLVGHGIGREVHEEPQVPERGAARVTGRSCGKGWFWRSSRCFRPDPRTSGPSKTDGPS